MEMGQHLLWDLMYLEDLTVGILLEEVEVKLLKIFMYIIQPFSNLLTSVNIFYEKINSTKC